MLNRQLMYGLSCCWWILCSFHSVPLESYGEPYILFISEVDVPRVSDYLNLSDSLTLCKHMYRWWYPWYVLYRPPVFPKYLFLLTRLSIPTHTRVPDPAPPETFPRRHLVSITSLYPILPRSQWTTSTPNVSTPTWSSDLGGVLLGFPVSPPPVLFLTP